MKKFSKNIIKTLNLVFKVIFMALDNIIEIEEKLQEIKDKKAGK